MNKDEEKTTELAFQLRHRLMDEYKKFFTENEKSLRGNTKIIFKINMSVFSSMIGEIIDRMFLKSVSIDHKLELIDDFYLVTKQMMVSNDIYKSRKN